MGAVTCCIILLLFSGAGAAVGTVLQGTILGEMPVAVGQALIVGTPIAATGNIDASEVNTLTQSVEYADGNGSDALWLGTGPDRSIGTVRDDRSVFQFAAEIDQGDVYAFWLPLKNASDEDLVGTLTLDYPECFTVEVLDAKGTTGTTAVARHSLDQWKFALAAGAEYGDDDSLLVVVSLDDTCTPGYYSIQGEIHQIAY